MLLFMVGSVSADGQTPTCATTGSTGFAELTFLRASSTFDQVLPFDVPVRLCTIAPANTPIATVQSVAQPLRSGPLQIDPKTCEISDSSATWSPEASSVPNDAGVVRWLIGRFEAERYYAFCFRFERELTPEELSDFRVKAQEVISETMKKENDANLTVTETQTLCESLKAELLDIASADRIVKPGTLFSCDSNLQTISSLSSELTAAVLGPQVLIARILDGKPAIGAAKAQPSLTEKRSKLFRAANDILDDPALKRLADLVEQRMTSDGEAALKIDQGFGDALTLERPGGATVLANQLRLSGGGTAVSVDTDPQTVETLASGVRQTEQALKQLAALIDTMSGANPPGGALAGLSANEITQLTALVDTTTQTSGQAFSLASVLDNLARQMKRRRAAIEAAAQMAKVAGAEVIVADASSTPSFATRQKNYVSLDAGMLFAPELDEGVPYVGTNIYFRPVNRDAPLRTLGNFGQTFSRRFSLTLGLTGSSISDVGSDGLKTRDDLFSSQSLIAGFGLRITDSMRLGAGALVFNETNPDPLIDDEELATTYYLSLSFDVNMVKLFGRLFGEQILPANSLPPNP